MRPGDDPGGDPGAAVRLRRATPEDFELVLPRTRALNTHEGIEVPAEVFEAALRQLLGDPSLGGCWLALRGGAPIGYAIATYGFDLEFGGREACLTELWIDPEARGGGAGRAVLDLLGPELRALGVRALHLQVRPENPAARMYERAGFQLSPRRVMVRRLEDPARDLASPRAAGGEAAGGEAAGGEAAGGEAAGGEAAGGAAPGGAAPGGGDD